MFINFYQKSLLERAIKAILNNDRETALMLIEKVMYEK